MHTKCFIKPLIKDGAFFCYYAYVVRIVGCSEICPLIQQYFWAVYDYVEKADLSKGYQSTHRKLGVTVHFFRDNWD